MLNHWAVDDEPTFVEVGVGGKVAVAPQALQLHVVEEGDGSVLDVATHIDHLKILNCKGTFLYSIGPTFSQLTRVRNQSNKTYFPLKYFKLSLVS